MKNNNNKSGLGIAAVVIVIAALLALLGGGDSSPLRAMGRSVLIIAIIVVILLVVLTVVIFYFALSSSKSEKEKKEQKIAKKGSISPENEKILTDARHEVVDLKLLINRIQDKSIRESGNEICQIFDEILAQLKEDPSDIPRTRQFLTYYIPTLHNILKTYQSLEKTNMNDADITEKVTGHLAQIKEASKKQYQNLFENEKLNLEVDMEVLQLACKRDGLL